MVFSSLVFLYAFLPLCLLFYRIPRGIRGRNTVLLVFSLIFYAWGEPIWILQMLLSGMLIFLFGLLIDKSRVLPRQKKIYLALALTSALLPLFIFKYSGFFMENLSALLGLHLTIPQLTMPIGISFYTFQIISYAVDLSRGDCKVQKNLADFWLYEALFPQLIAGPIVRYVDVEHEIYERSTTANDLAEGLKRFVTGLAKKTIVANYAGSIVEQTWGSGRLSSLSSLEMLLGCIAFTFQIYYDFSAYSDMAIGLGRIFGFHFKENFNYPYIAASVTDFWRRWHISLGTFFRDYVYIPLGGNRKHQYFNIFLVWFLTGFWHGASWNFIIWGLYFCAFLVLEKTILLARLQRSSRVLQTLYMLPIILFGWAIFYFTDLSQLSIFFRRLFGLDGAVFAGLEARLLFRQNWLFFALAMLGACPVFPWLKKRYPLTQSARFRASGLYLSVTLVRVLGLLLLSTAALAGQSFNPFLYFRF